MKTWQKVGIGWFLFLPLCFHGAAKNPKENEAKRVAATALPVAPPVPSPAPVPTAKPNDPLEGWMTVPPFTKWEGNDVFVHKSSVHKAGDRFEASVMISNPKFGGITSPKPAPGQSVSMLITARFECEGDMRVKVTSWKHFDKPADMALQGLAKPTKQSSDFGDMVPDMGGGTVGSLLFTMAGAVCTAAGVAGN